MHLTHKEKIVDLPAKQAQSSATSTCSVCSGFFQALPATGDDANKMLLQSPRQSLCIAVPA